jgi:predicted membrane-bound dolichyl-phosphate-mannose-protein mannosyltransferase
MLQIYDNWRLNTPIVSNRQIQMRSMQWKADKITFDEVYWVPAAKQMLEPGIPNPVLNPMHPPVAKQLTALSTRSFGDGPFGWRYPSVVFGSFAIVAMYLCGLTLFAAQGPPSPPRC